MKTRKRKKLEAAGWKVGSAREFLGLTPEEAAFVELKLTLSANLKKRRMSQGLSQNELAKRLRSSQSRVAKMEASDPAVSLDLLIRALLAAGAKKERHIESDVYERLCRARDFIDLCYDQPLNLDQISSQACFSRYHFLRLFRRAFNKTPHQYLVERRIQKAKELLSAKDLRVTDICFEVGFQSLGSFSSLFHKCVGHPPVTYRERMRQIEAARQKVPGCFLVMHKLEPITTTV